MSNLLEPRFVFRPLEYPEAEEYTMAQLNAHWVHTEASMTTDVHDWKHNLTDAERGLIGSVLKGFTQTEVVVGHYWGGLVPKWFKKPEVQVMARTFAAMEGVHVLGYSHLDTTLGLDDFDAFLYNEEAKAKLDLLLEINDHESIDDMARSLAIFSGFAEGVSLFSSFAILLKFSHLNLLKGVGQIISWSVRDESLHSKAGCWLFRTLCSENEGLIDRVQSAVYEGARTVAKLEFDFVEMCFSHGSVAGLDKDDIIQMIMHRTNIKLKDLGYEPLYEVDQEALTRMGWFDDHVAGVEFQDFFDRRPTAYSKGTVDWSDAFNDHS
jgi:ribonucleoside-diphosphate reductase beta chain